MSVDCTHCGGGCRKGRKDSGTSSVTRAIDGIHDIVLDQVPGDGHGTSNG